MIEQLYQSLLPGIGHFHSLAYWAAFVAAFAETALVVGLLVPGSTLLLLLGALSATGTIDLAGVFWFGVAGAVLGDNLNYWLGRRYGQRWVRSGVGFLEPAHFQRAHDFFERNGAKSVFLGRFVPSLKEVVPFVAGSLGMHRGRFLLWNLLGAIGWGLQWIGGGYLFGQSLALAQAWMSRIGLLFLAVLLLWLALWYLKHALLRLGPQIWLLVRSLSRSIARALAGNPHVIAFRRRHPGLVTFVRERLDRDRFRGLPLTLLSLSLLYIAILFGGIVEDLLTSDPIVAVDQAVAQLMLRFRPPELIPVFTWITALGIPKVAGPLVLLALLGTWLARGPWLALSLLVSVGGTGAFTLLSKLAFHRPRPVEAVLLEQSYSFPSGHASIAVGFYGFLGYVLARSAPGLKSRIDRLILAALLILAIGLSRLVLGVHYLSDVWAGYLVGAGWLTIAIAFSEWATHAGRIDWQARLPASRRGALWALSLAALAWYGLSTARWHPRVHTPPPVTIEQVRGSLADFIRQKGTTHTETLLGAPSQPLSLAFLAPDRATLIRRLRAAGWQPADPLTPGNLLELLKQGMDYPNAPLAPVFWHGRINDLGLERAAIADGERVIDTLRIWQTPWRISGRPVFVAVARSYDAMYWGLLHRIAPDTDAAARRVLASLAGAGEAPPHCTARLGRAESGNYLLGMPYFSSGHLLVVALDGELSAAVCGDTASTGE